MSYRGKCTAGFDKEDKLTDLFFNFETLPKSQIAQLNTDAGLHTQRKTLRMERRCKWLRRIEKNLEIILVS